MNDMTDDEFLERLGSVSTPLITNAPASGLAWPDYIFAIGLAIRGIMSRIVDVGVMTEEEVRDKVDSILAEAFAQKVAVMEAHEELGMTPGLHGIRKTETKH